MSIVNQIISWLEYLSKTINLELFVIIGSFLEELVAPIPSPFVMTTAAALAQSQNYVFWQLAAVVIISSVAKTASSCVIYVAADKFEDIVIGKFGKYIGVSHQLIEQIGSFLTGTWIDNFLLILARALPFMSTGLISVGAGVIKYNFKSFALMTFLGVIIRNGFYLWAGYFGWTQLENIWQQIKGNPIFIGLLGLALIFLVWLLFKLKDYLFDKFINLKKQPKKEVK